MIQERERERESRKHGCGFRVATPAPDSSRRGVRSSNSPFLPFFFFSIRVDSGKNRQIWPDSCGNGSQHGRISPIPAERAIEIDYVVGFREVRTSQFISRYSVVQSARLRCPRRYASKSMPAERRPHGPSSPRWA